MLDAMKVLGGLHPSHPVRAEHPVRVGFQRPFSIGAFQSAELQVVKKLPGNMQIISKENGAGAQELLFIGACFHFTALDGWRLHSLFENPGSASRA